MRLVVSLILLVTFSQTARAQIPKPTDAPKLMSPDSSLKPFKLPTGLKMELVASEPLVKEPTGVCWDSRGQLYV